MVLFDGGLALVAFGVWVFCLIDVITTPSDRCRNLPKIIWLAVVVLLAEVGALAWLIGGRDWNRRAAAGAAPGPADRGVPARRPVAPDDDEEFLAQLRARAEEQRRRAREAREREDPADGASG